MTLVTGPVTVTTPATSANLGPGFDALGLALDLRDELEATVTESGLGVDVVGEGAGDVARDETHLVVRAMRAAFDALGERPGGLLVSCRNRIPHARGLGSSSAAIVGGIALARALVEGGATRLDLDACLTLATALEGHPDNVAPALLGGLVVCGQDADGVWAHRAPIDDRVGVVAFVPPTGLATELARELLPQSVSHADAVANTSRASLLVAALGSAPDRLLRGTEDFLHQEYRRPAMPESLGLVDRLRADGHAAVVSGAGPTVVVLRADHRDLSAYTPPDWACRPLPVSPRGVEVRA